MSDNDNPFPAKNRPAGVAPVRSTRTFPESAPEGDRAPVVRSLTEVAAHDGQLVRVVGTYVEASGSARPGAPLDGHAAIELPDGTRLALLPVWHADARRPESEVTALKGRPVESVGVAHARAPADPSGGASPVDPCLSDVRALRPAR